MSKITLLIGIASLTVLFLSGVIHVELRTDRLSAVPGTIQGIVSNGGLLASAKTHITSWKRAAELYVADSASNKMELAMKYTEVDTGHLQKSLEQHEQPEVIIPEAELLLDSVSQMKEYAAQLSEEELAALAEESKLISANTRGVLAQLQEVQKDYASFEERLANVTDTLQLRLGEPEQSPGEVAGAADESTKTESTPTPPPTDIPLKF